MHCQVVVSGSDHHALYCIVFIANCWDSPSSSFLSLILLLQTIATMTITSSTTTTSSSTVQATTAITMIISCDSPVLEVGVGVGCDNVGVLVKVIMVLKVLLG